MSRNQLIPPPICALFARRNDCVSERLTESWVSNSRQTLISGSEVVVADENRHRNATKPLTAMQLPGELPS